MDILEKECMRAMEVLQNWMILSDALPRTRMGFCFRAHVSASRISIEIISFKTTVPQVL
jgi:hypothetical protein